LDAYACLWTAKRIAENQSKSFPQDNVQDGVGLIMEIVA
jgi:predicted RNase H-like nuclease